MKALHIDRLQSNTVVPVPATERLIQGWLAAGDLLGAQVFVGTPDQTVADVALGSSAPGRPATAADTARLYCTAKPLTTVLVGRAVDAGMLHLDDVVARFMPVADDRYRRGMTVRSLLTHSVGFPPNFGSETAEELVDRATREEIPPWMWAPGPHYETVLAWHVLAALVQRAYGAPVEELVRREISEPLGDLGLTLEPPDPRRYVTLSKRLAPHEFGSTGPDQLTRVNPAFGGVGSAADLGALQQELLRCLEGRGALLTAATAADLVLPRTRVAMGPGLRTATWGSGFEVGLAGDSLSGDWSPRTFGHRGTVFVRTVVQTFADPVRGIAGVIRLFSVDARSNWRVWRISAAISDDLRAAGC
jgi:CubicO group peptidase (beta-lactamase class C family)